MAMVDEKWGRNQQVAAYDSFAILRPVRWGSDIHVMLALHHSPGQVRVTKTKRHGAERGDELL